MKARMVAVIVGAAAMLLPAGVAVPDITIATVPVGNVGNVADSTGYGAVGYVYNIGTYEVSNAEYAEFLNAVATVGDPHGLYNPNMGGGLNDIGGISRTGSGTGGDPWVYSTRTTRGNRPVNYVDFWDTCRFANWLHNGQGSGDTETGAYFLNGVTNPTNSSITREADWTWAVTSEDEWYKAAYHMNDGVTGNYYDYPTGSDSAPTAETPPGMDMTDGSANYYDGGYVDTTYYTTECGAYDAKPSDSPYGTFDQGGNVAEWNEAIVETSRRGVRGGAFYSVGSSLRAGSSGMDNPTFENNSRGFRVSQVLEILPGDTNGDECVDGLDYNKWSLHYQECGHPTWSNGGYTVGNFNEDNCVDGLDYNKWSLNYLTGCDGAEAPIPEPAFAALLIAACLPLLRRSQTRRRGRR